MILERCLSKRAGAPWVPLSYFWLLVGWAGLFWWGCGAPQAPQPSPAIPRPITRYPSWFLETPVGPYAVGYSSPYHHEESAVAIATEVAARALAIEEQVSIRGGRGIIQDALGTFLAGSDLREAVDESQVKAFNRTERVVATSSTDTLVMVLLSKQTVSDSLKTSYQGSSIPMPSDPPSWITTLPKEEGYLYSVGVAMGFHHERSSWEAAERNARFSLAHGISSQTKLRQRMLNQRFDGTTEVNVNATLYGVRILKRWRNPKDGTFYVLARANLTASR